MKRHLQRTTISVAIGALFIWLSLRQWSFDKLDGDIRFENGHLAVGNVPVPAAGQTMIETSADMHGWVFNLDWLWPYLAILTFIHVLRVVRFKPLLDPIIKLDWATHNRIGAVGFMAMFLFPLRLGEFVRPYLVKKETQGKARMSAVMATVVVERIVDGLMVSLLLCLVLFFIPKGDVETERLMLVGALASLGLFIGASLFLIIAVWQKDRAVSLLNGTIGRLSKRITARIMDILDAFLLALRSFPRQRDLWLFVGLTAVYWLINGIGVWTMVKAFYLPIDLVGAYAMMATVVCGMMIPNSPGNVGSFWFFLLVPAPLYGIAEGSTQAIACGLMIWLFQLIQQTSFGAYFVLRGKVSLNRVLEATREDESSLRDDLVPVVKDTTSGDN
jgi:uncharacterized protein (TIRG00374 family)